MKKLTALLLTVSVILSLASCGGTESASTTTSGATTTTAATEGTTTPETTTTEETTTTPETTDSDEEAVTSEVTTTTPETTTTTSASETSDSATTTTVTTTAPTTTTTKVTTTTTKPVTTTAPKTEAATLPNVDATPEEIENSNNWLIIEDVQYKGLTVVGCSEKAYGKIVVPEGVKSIDENVFANCPNVTTVILPSTINSLYLAAFNGASGLECIIADAKYYSSMDGVLFNQDKTQLIRYPEGKNGSSYTVPSSVTGIAPHAFNSCEQLESITIPDGVRTIDWCAFQNCTGLKSITLPDSVNCIIIDAFMGCTDITVNYNGKTYTYNELYEIYSLE